MCKGSTAFGKNTTLGNGKRRAMPLKSAGIVESIGMNSPPCWGSVLFACELFGSRPTLGRWIEGDRRDQGFVRPETALRRGIVQDSREALLHLSPEARD